MGPTGASIQAEFGVFIYGPGEIGRPGWWYAKIPGTHFWVDGHGLAELRTNLIKAKWLKDHATPVTKAARAARERRDPGPETPPGRGPGGPVAKTTPAAIGAGRSRP